MARYNHLAAPSPASPSTLRRKWPKFNGLFYRTTLASVLEEEVPSLLTPLAFPLLKPTTRPMAIFQLKQPKRTHLQVTLSTLLKDALAPQRDARAVPFCHLTTALVLASSEVDRSLRYASVAQVLLAAAVRRLLVLADFTRWEVLLKGLIPGFGLFWRLLNTPRQELYSHPITGALVADIRLAGRGAPGTRLKAALEAATPLTDVGEPALAVIDPALVAWADSPKGAAPSATRYNLCWHQVIINLKTPHGKVKSKRARGIKKRLSKKLVSATQRRFWVL